jgi:hypothetical protein
MNYIVEIPFAIDILDAATYRCLPGYAPGFVDFTREQPTFGSVIYYLQQEQLGALGSIELHKIHAEVTALHVNGPPKPEDDEAILYVTQTKLAGKVDLFDRVNNLIESGAPAWLVALIIYELVPPEKAAQRSGDDGATMWYLALPRSESLPLFAQVHEVLGTARKALHDKRKEHHQLVLEAFDNRLRDDGFMTISQRLASRASNPPKSDRSKHSTSTGRLPPQPAKDASREEWFEYKRLMGRKFTHKVLAAALGLDDEYVRQLYAMWHAGIEDETSQNT